TQRIGIDISPRLIEIARKRHPSIQFRVADVENDPLPEGPFDLIILSELVGHVFDVQLTLERLRALLSKNGRIVVTMYNFVWDPVLRIAETVGLRTPWPEQNWLSMKDVENILHLADYDVVRRGTHTLIPRFVPGIGTLLNRGVAGLPGIRHLALNC